MPEHRISHLCTASEHQQCSGLVNLGPGVRGVAHCTCPCHTATPARTASREQAAVDEAQRALTLAQQEQQTAAVQYAQAVADAQTALSAAQQGLADNTQPPGPRRPKLLVDFDGVLHTYQHGWGDGSVYGGPMPGAQHALEQLTTAGYEVVIFSTRNAAQISAALLAWGWPAYRVTNRKEPAVALVDDRAVRFTSWAQALQDVTTWYPVRRG